MMVDPSRLHSEADVSRLPVSSPVYRSWARSREAGLRPTDAPEYDELPLVSPYRRDHPANRRLWQYTREEVEQLWGAFGGTDWIIMCISPEGEIVHARRSPYSQEDTLKPIVAGRSLREQSVGTTAPGCVLHEHAEAVVIGDAHYLKAFANVFCMAVPLFDADGQVAGVLDITGMGKRNVPLLREHFQLAALSVQQRFFSALRHCHLLRVSYDARLLDSSLAGVIAVEEDGRIRAISQQARRLMDIPLEGPLPFNVYLRDLFPMARAAQRRRFLAPSDRAQRVPLQTGMHIWVRHASPPRHRSHAHWVQPHEPSGEAPVGDVVAGASLRENELLAIEQALLEHHGNMAAAARQLGISRTTLYAKLRRMRAHR